MNSAIKDAFSQNAARAVELASDHKWIAETFGNAAGEGQFAFDCPPLPRIVAGLRGGFTAEEELAAPQQPDFQRMVRVYWRLRPVSFWMLARHAAEGSRFPFRAAISQHLLEDSAEASRLARDSQFTHRLTAAMQKLEAAKGAWHRLRERVTSWENSSRWFVTDLPLTSSFAPADEEVESFHDGRQFEDGLAVHLEEIRSSRLHIAASRPSAGNGPETLAINLIGESGESLPASVSLRPSTETSGGRADVGAFDQVRSFLGSRCLVVISPEPFPDLE